MATDGSTGTISSTGGGGSTGMAPGLTTIGSTGAAAAPSTGQAPYFADDWRERYAGQDTKKLERLKRYPAPDAVFDALIGLQARIGAGELRSALPANTTPEQMKTWRAENGIPAEAKDYDITGLNIDKADEDKVGKFLARAHAQNYTNAQARDALTWHYDEVTGDTALRQQQDVTDAQATADALHATWGGNYRGNVNAINAFLTTAPPEVAEKIRNGRGPDGKAIMNDQAVLQWLASTALLINPAGSILPIEGGNIQATIEDRLTAIHKTMSTNRKAYNADTKMQGEYQQLLDAFTKQTGKTWQPGAMAK